MACGCSGKAAVGLRTAGVGMGTSAIAPTGVKANRLVYRVLARGTVDPQDCVARDTNANCINFTSLSAAGAYKIDHQLDGTPVGVIAEIDVTELNVGVP